MKLVERGKGLFLVFITCFILGILYTNLLAVDYLTMTGVFNHYYLREFADSVTNVEEYLPYLLTVRVMPLVCLIVLAYSKVHKVSAVLFLIWTGFLWGIYMSMGIIQMGLKGVLFGLVGLFPHMLFYVPSYLIVLIFTYKYPEARWNPIKVIMIILCMIIGIGLECYINPVMLKGLINYI